MADDEISPEEEAEFKRVCAAVHAVLSGTNLSMCLSVLSSVAADVCAECDYPQDAGLSFAGEFLHYLDHAIDEIPAESVIDIPMPPETN